MEWIDGRSLSSLLQDGPLPPRRAATFLQRVAEALHYAHRQGVLHRDIKPGNILIDDHDVPRITDFGLAKRLQESPSDPKPAADSDITLSGQILGTPAYLSPEQASASRALDARSEVYSLGAVLYHAITGRPPFQGESPTQVLRQVLETDPVSPRSLNPAIPQDLETICLHCLEKEPSRRYATASDLAADLERCLEGRPVQARPVHALEKAWRWSRRQPALAISIVSIVLLLATIASVSSIAARRLDRLHHRTLQLLYASDMRLAQDALKAGKIGATRELLERHRPAPGQPDVRGFEWFFLQDQSQSDELATLEPHPGQAQRATWSPDGRSFATAATDLKVWDADTFQLRFTATVSNYVRAIRFSDDSSRVAVAEITGTLMAFDSRTGQRIAQHHTPDRRPFALQWTGPTQMRVWSAQHIDLWSIPEGTLQPDGTLPGESSRDAITEGGLFLTGRKNPPEMQVWQAQQLLVTVPAPDLPIAFAGSQDGRHFALGEFSGALSLVVTGPTPRTNRFTAHRGLVNVLTFSPDGARVASGGIDGVIRLWDVHQGTPLNEWRGHRKPIWSIAFSPDGERLVSGAGDGSVKVWKTQTRRRTTATAGKEVLWLAPGGIGWTETHSNALHFIDVSRPESPVATHPVTNEFGSVVALAANGFLRCSTQGSLSFQPLVGAPESLPFPPTSTPSLVRISPDARHLAYPLAHTNVYTLRPRDGSRERFQWTYSQGGPHLLAFSADGHWAALGDLTGQIQCVHLPTTEPPLLLQAHSHHAYAAAFSPNGQRLVSAGHDGQVRLWELPSGRNLGTYRSTVETYWTVCLSPDGTRIAAGTDESSVVLWDVRSQLEVISLSFRSEPRLVQGSLTFSPDSSSLLLTEGGTLHHWHAPR
jgi:WD40 repeat protein